MPKLTVHLFGYPRVMTGDAEVPIRRRKALALVAYLATTGTSHSRDALAALLWPEHDASRAYAFLRNALWIINQTPLSNWLTASRYTIGLQMNDELIVDVRSFRQALVRCLADDSKSCVGSLEKALQPCDADFLAGFSIDESEPFEDWHYSESSALRHEIGTAFDRLATVYGARGQTDAAINTLRRWVQREPLDEEIHRRLIEALATSGERSAAIRQFESCKQLLWEGLSLEPSEETSRLMDRIRADHPSPRRPPPPANRPVNLPTYRTPFVGRESELARVIEILRTGDCRLLSITGAGGYGKTRLAVEAARQTADAFPDGVVFVPLVSTASSSDVPLEIEDVLAAFAAPDAVDQEPNESPGLLSDKLLSRLKPQRMLLVLDSMEHLLKDLRWLDSLLEKATNIRILVTSRQQLNLHDEWILSLEGMRIPRSYVAHEELRAYDSVSLFLQTAKRANPRFTPEPRDWPAIASIVSRLEGNPLGIEIAAAWIRTATCETIAEEIAKNMDFLASRMRDIPRRHQSLRAAFDHSWRLLSKEHRDAFRALSVFRGGFTLDAAQAVTHASLPVVSGLVARSLLRPSEQNRLEMHQILRQYAEERLELSPEQGASIRDEHASYYLSLLAEQEQPLKGSRQKIASQFLLADLDNIRSAWRWAIERQSTDLLSHSAMALFLFCDMRNHFDEGARLFREAADAYATLPAEATRHFYGYARALQAWFTGMRQTHAVAAPLFQEAIDVLGAYPASWELGISSLVAAFADQPQDGLHEERLREALGFFEETQATWEQAEVLEALSWRALRHDKDEALRCATRAVEIHEEINDPWGIAMSLYALGSLHAYIGHAEQARTSITESLILRRENELDPGGAMQCLASLGFLETQQGNLVQAAEHYQEVLTIAEDSGARWAQATAHEALVEVFWRQGDPAQAAEHAKAAASMFHSFGLEEQAQNCERILATLQDPQD